MEESAQRRYISLIAVRQEDMPVMAAGCLVMTPRPAGEPARPNSAAARKRSSSTAFTSIRLPGTSTIELYVAFRSALSAACLVRAHADDLRIKGGAVNMLAGRRSAAHYNAERATTEYQR